MTLSIKDIYKRYSVRDFCRKIEVKRLFANGTYESDWNDVEVLSGLKLLDDSVQSINYKASNNNYAYGIVTIGNVNIKLNSKNGQFDDENNSASIFKGFLRHKSLIRIRDGYIDKYTDETSPVAVYRTVFEGFIDETATGTKVDDNNLLQNLQCVDTLSFLLKQFTIADMGALTSTTINALVYEILHRSQFTTFFTVSSSNIAAGYNISSFDITQYEGQTQLFTLFSEFSIGHSFFFVRDNVFYYKPILQGINADFTLDEKKLINFSSYSSGVQNVFELFFWEGDDSVSFTSASNRFNKSQTISIKGVTDNAQRQNVLNTVGNIAKIQRREFLVKMPYYMEIFVMDQIVVESPQIIPDDAFIWGVSRWGEGKRWRKAIQADNIANNATWLVREVKHSNFQTQLILQEIIV